MEHLKFVKGFGLFLILLGLVISVGTAIYMQQIDPVETYKYGLLSGVAIGVALCGAILRLYSASNE